MKFAVIENDYISKYLGEVELPEDATDEQIDAAVDELTGRVQMGGLCHQCAESVGDLSGAGEIIVEREDGVIVRDDTYSATLREQLDAAQQRIRELEALLEAH